MTFASFVSYLKKHLKAVDYLNYFLVLITLIVARHLGWSKVDTLTVGFLIWFVFYPLKSQICVKLGLASLLFVPCLLIMHKDDLAEQFAIFAYYFLVLTVVTAILEIKREKAANAS